MSKNIIRATTSKIYEQYGPSFKYCKINVQNLQNELDTHPELYHTNQLPSNWQQSYHYYNPSRPDLTVQYIFVLDCINFCFWPCPTYEYAELASGLKRALDENEHAFDADALQNLKPETLSEWLQPIGKERVVIPLLEQRIAVLQDLGRVLEQKYEGKAINVVALANKDVNKLIDLISTSFEGFRDYCTYKGHHVDIYKRAQILIGDLWGAFEGKSYGEFTNIEELTCFADYRLPQLLRAVGIFEYSEELAHKVDNKIEIVKGSEEELEIRISTVIVVEMMIKYLNDKHNFNIKSLQLDWILWERGEALLNQLAPHHRVLTTFY